MAKGRKANQANTVDKITITIELPFSENEEGAIKTTSLSVGVQWDTMMYPKGTRTEEKMSMNPLPESRKGRRLLIDLVARQVADVIAEVLDRP